LDTIADVVPRERSIGVFGRVNVYTIMASLASLVSGATVFRLIQWSNPGIQGSAILYPLP